MPSTKKLYLLRKTQFTKPKTAVTTPRSRSARRRRELCKSHAQIAAYADVSRSRDAAADKGEVIARNR